MMPNPDELPPDIRFTGVWIFRKDLVYIRAVIKSLDDEGVEHAAMFRFDGSNWTQYIIRVPGVAHCVIPESERTVLTLSPYGVVHVAKPEGFSWERFDEFKDGPNNLRHMRDLRPIAGNVYAVGMDRMVFRRSPGGTWSPWNKGLINSTNEISGFLTIDGCLDHLMYVAGFSGEMWFFDGDSWNRIVSPTNVKIERIRSINPELTVACGAGGLILRGAKDKWEAIDQHLTKAVFWGLEYFEDAFYLATTNGVFRLDGDNLSRVDMKIPGPITTARLHAADGVLWSVGAKDIVVLDGSNWSRIELPRKQ